MKQPETITIAEYKRLTSGPRRSRKRTVDVPRPQAEPRTPAGWTADYDRAGAAGWQFTQGADWCYAWKPGGGRTAEYPLLVYASAAGTLRLAVVAALEAE
jgi:hypothetical protein